MLVALHEQGHLCDVCLQTVVPDHSNMSQGSNTGGLTREQWGPMVTERGRWGNDMDDKWVGGWGPRGFLGSSCNAHSCSTVTRTSEWLCWLMAGASMGVMAVICVSRSTKREKAK